MPKGVPKTFDSVSCKRGHLRLAYGKNRDGQCRGCKNRTTKLRYGGDEKERIRQKEKCWRGYGVRVASGADFRMADYNALFAAQGGRCAVCGASADRYRKGLHVDHDHTTGVARGLLCILCNTKAGVLENPIYPALRSYLDVCQRTVR